jgi:hypothetical protein
MMYFSFASIFCKGPDSCWISFFCKGGWINFVCKGPDGGGLRLVENL